MPKFIPNETLLWINLSKFKILDAGLEKRIIHRNTLQGLKKQIGQDPVSNVAEYVGARESQEYLDSIRNQVPSTSDAVASTTSSSSSSLPPPRPPNRPSNNFTFKLPPIERKGGKYKHKSKSKSQRKKHKGKTKKNKRKPSKGKGKK